MNIRIVGLAVAAIGAMTATLPLWADDGDQLPLPAALASDDLSRQTARGDGESDVKVQNISSQASAEASIDHVTIIGPNSTGGISGLTDLIGNTDSAILQISTGSGNIQQGVQAVALSF